MNHFSNINDTFTLHNGITIPCVGYGTYKVAAQEAKASVAAAIQAGYRHIDTAAFYNRDEQNKVFPRFEGRMPGAKSGGMEFWSTKRRHSRKLYRKDASVKELSRSSQRLCCPERVTGP